MNLNDVGETVEFITYQYGRYCTNPVKVLMGIKAPRGQMFLFDCIVCGTGREYFYTTEKCKAIKAFMEEHSND